MHDSPNTQVVLKNMSKTNPVVLNGASIAGAAGVELNDGDEVVFPSAESERIVFKYRLVAKETGAVLGALKSVGGADAKDNAPKSPLGERNGDGMVAKSPAKKAATPAKSPAKKAATPAKKAATPAKAPTPVKKDGTPAKSAMSAAKSPGPTPHTRASRALVASAVEALVAAENDAAAANQASPAKKAATPAKKAATPAKSPAKKAPTPAKSPKAQPPKSAAKSPGLTPHTRAARDIVASAVDSLVAEEAAAMETEEEPEEAAAAESPAVSKSPASARKSPRWAKKQSVSPAAPAAVEPAAVEPASALPASASPGSPATSPAKAPSPAPDVAHALKAAPSPMLSPRPSLKAPEARIGAQVPGSASRRKSLGIRFVADEAMEQVRFIPPHNGEPEVCGRIAPNQSALMSSEKRKRTPSRRYSDAVSEAISEGVEEEEAEDDAPVNRVGCVGHTGPIPRFVAPAPESAPAAVAAPGASAAPAASPSAREAKASRKRSLASPICSTGKSSKRSAVSFAIGQAEVTDDVAGTPVERKRRGSSGFKRKGTPHAPPSRVEEEEEEEEEMEEEEETKNEEETENEEMDDEEGEEEVVEGVDVMVVEEGVLGSGGTGAPSSVAGTVLDETDADASGSALGGDTADDIPVFRLGDVGNTGPIPHYSPACKASPMSTIKSAVKSSPSGISAPPSTGGRSTRSTRSTRSRRSSAGVGGRAPANTPAAGPAATDTAAAAAAALVRGLEGIACTIAQTPGGHARHGAVARILAMEAEEEASLAVAAETPAEASPAPTMLDVDVTREEIISAATPFVARAEAEGEDAEMISPAFDFDEAFAVDAALAVEGVADVEAAVEIEHILEAAQGKTPEKVEKWLEQNLAEALVEEANGEAGDDAAGADAGAATPASAVRAATERALSPATVIIKARGGSAGGRRLAGGLSSRVAQIHRALRATRAALLREKQKSADLEKLYLAAAKHAAEAREVAAAAGAEVAAAAAAAVAATAELQEERNAPKQVVELKIVVAEPPACVPAEVRDPAAAGDCDSVGCDSEACKVCGVADERDALLCDGCDGAFHMGCLKPPRKRVPAGDWFCKPCAAERKPAPKRRAAAPAEGGARRSARTRS